MADVSDNVHASGQQSSPTGRLAPSPTGLLHLGNAWSFLLAWLATRLEGGRVILRMEDIDPARSRREWADAIQEDLRWLGLDWDEGPDVGGACGPYEQSARGDLYERALAELECAGHVYPCFCTRKELRDVAGAPHGNAQHGGGPFSSAVNAVGDAGVLYSGTCRRLAAEERAARRKAGKHFCWRMACPEGEGESFIDAVLGSQRMSFADCGGDFALRRSDGVWAYQLAVSVDDASMGVTQVVRGEDILWSTPRQLLLFRLWGLRPPCYAHIPLLHDSAGERLAKRHQSLSLRALRDAGVRPEAVIGWLGGLVGLGGLPGWGGWAQPTESITPQALRERLRVGGLPWQRLREQSLRGNMLRVPDDLCAVLRRQAHA